MAGPLAADGGHVGELRQRAAGGATLPCMSWLSGWPGTSAWMSCANSSSGTGSCWQAGWPGTMA